MVYRLESFPFHRKAMISLFNGGGGRYNKNLRPTHMHAHHRGQIKI